MDGARKKKITLTEVIQTQKTNILCIPLYVILAFKPSIHMLTFIQTQVRCRVGDEEGRMNSQGRGNRIYNYGETGTEGLMGERKRERCHSSWFPFDPSNGSF